MRLAIISDIHANLQALEAVLRDMEKQIPDHVICLGDLVGYGAFPSECIQLVQKHCSQVILGNHDSVCAGIDSLDDYYEEAQISLEWTRNRLDESEQEYLAGLPYILEGEQTIYVHASLHCPEQWEYIDYEELLRLHFENQETPVCFAGHTHLPAIFGRKAMASAALSWNSPLPLPKDQQILVNPGSVGQPRDQDPRACYVIYDEAQRIVTYRRVRYEIARAQNGIRAVKMPSFLAERLAEGI